jgi:hypothetical protein
MSDEVDPVLEAVTALRATGVVVTSIGDELDRWQIGDLTVSDAELWRLAESRGLIADGERAAVARARAESSFAPRRPAAPGYPPARSGGAHARAVDGHRARQAARSRARHARDPRVGAPGGRWTRGQRDPPGPDALALCGGRSRLRTIRARSRRVTMCIGHSRHTASNAAIAPFSG